SRRATPPSLFQHRPGHPRDITGEFISTRALQAVATYAGGGGTTQNTNVYTGNVTSAVIMANVYADLGKYSGLTPYVGAGVGAAYNNMSNLYENASWTGGAGSPTFGYLPGGSKWSLAWALHAGMSYDLSPNLKLDAGYSFKDLGEVSTHGASICATNPCNAESVKLKDLYTHSVHVGARWMLDAPAAKTPVYAAPVVAKY
ncbi:MAG: outer membrane beta-barrel protein, partial [Hyphomicrobiales bacterium]|nr:outer membrane beta-barrel protein [Hyphomicrobiales bacterium]